MIKLRETVKRICSQFKSRVFLIWILSYTVIVVVSLVFFGVASNAIEHRVLEAYSENSLANHKHIETLINRELDDISHQSYILSHDSLINAFAARDPIRLQDRTRLKQIQDNLAAQAAVMSTKSQTVIFFENIAKLLSKDTIYGFDSIWDEQLNELSLDKEDWALLLSDTHYNDLFLLDNESTGKVQILNLTTPQFGNSRNSHSTIVQFYDSSYLYDVIDLFSEPETITGLVDASGKYIVGTSEQDWASLLSSFRLTPQNEGRIVVDDGSTESIVYLSQISSTGWYLVTLLPGTVVDSSTDWLRAIVVPLLLVYLLLGLALALIMSQINYTPLERLKRALLATAPVDGVPADRTVNEYQYIHQQFAYLQANMSESEALLASTSRVMKQEFLTSAVFRPAANNALLRESFQSVGLTLDGEYFSVLVTMVHANNNDVDTVPSQILTELLYYYSQHLIQKSENLSGITPYYLVTDHINALLFNFDQEGAYDALSAVIDEIIVQQKRETPGHDIIAYMSRLVRGVGQIHLA